MIPPLKPIRHTITLYTPPHLLPPRRWPCPLTVFFLVALDGLDPPRGACPDARADPVHRAPRALLLVLMRGALDVR